MWLGREGEAKGFGRGGGRINPTWTASAYRGRYCSNEEDEVTELDRFGEMNLILRMYMNIHYEISTNSKQIQ